MLPPAASLAPLSSEAQKQRDPASSSPSVILSLGHPARCPRSHAISSAQGHGTAGCRGGRPLRTPGPMFLERGSFLGRHVWKWVALFCHLAGTSQGCQWAWDMSGQPRPRTGPGAQGAQGARTPRSSLLPVWSPAPLRPVQTEGPSRVVRFPDGRDASGSVWSSGRRRAGACDGTRPLP